MSITPRVFCLNNSLKANMRVRPSSVEGEQDCEGITWDYLSQFAALTSKKHTNDQSVLLGSTGDSKK